MSANVEPEEVKAIMDLFGSSDTRRGPSEVAERDFKQPRRLSPARSQELSRRLLRGLTRLDQALALILGRRFKLELVGVSEVSAEGLFDSPALPLTLGEFEVAGQPAWVAWQNEAAVAAVETILGASKLTGATRELSVMERRVLARIFGAVAAYSTETIGLSSSELRTVTDPDTIRGWKDCEGETDAHRTSLDLTFHGPGGASTFHVYLPGVSTEVAEAARSIAAADVPPEHLAPVELDVTVELGASQVSLQDLLAIEVGDVIPLETYVGDPLLIKVEGVPCATGRLGTSHGKLAVKIHTAETTAANA